MHGSLNSPERQDLQSSAQPVRPARLYVRLLIIRVSKRCSRDVELQALSQLDNHIRVFCGPDWEGQLVDVDHADHGICPQAGRSPLVVLANPVRWSFVASSGRDPAIVTQAILSERRKNFCDVICMR